MQFLRYLLIQGVAYGLDMGAFVLLFAHMSVAPLVANLVGKGLAGLFAFVAHRNFTFAVARSGRPSQQSVRYFTLLALNIPLSTLMLSAMLWVTPKAVPVKFVADLFCVFLTYWLSKRFVFLGSSTLPQTFADSGSEQ